LTFEVFPTPLAPMTGAPPAPSEVSDAGAPHAANATETTGPAKTSAKDEPRNRGETIPSVFIQQRNERVHFRSRLRSIAGKSAR
jgi:hypothetical protein